MYCIMLLAPGARDLKKGGLLLQPRARRGGLRAGSRQGLAQLGRLEHEEAAEAVVPLVEHARGDDLGTVSGHAHGMQ